MADLKRSPVTGRLHNVARSALSQAIAFALRAPARDPRSFWARA